MNDSQRTIKAYARGGMSAHTMRAFAGMIETGEATLDDFLACDIHLDQIANKFGPPNCWTGTTGSAAAALRHAISPTA